MAAARGTEENVALLGAEIQHSRGIMGTFQSKSKRVFETAGTPPVDLWEDAGLGAAAAAAAAAAVAAESEDSANEENDNITLVIAEEMAELTMKIMI